MMMINRVARFCSYLLTSSKCKELPVHYPEQEKEVIDNVYS